MVKLFVVEAVLWFGAVGDHFDQQHRGEGMTKRWHLLEEGGVIDSPPLAGHQVEFFYCLTCKGR